MATEITSESAPSASRCYAAGERLETTMKFGIIEAKSFCESHEDIRVRLVWKWLCECRSKNAQWCEALNKEQSKVRSYEDFLSQSAPPSNS